MRLSIASSSRRPESGYASPLSGWRHRSGGPPLPSRNGDPERVRGPAGAFAEEGVNEIESPGARGIAAGDRVRAAAGTLAESDQIALQRAASLVDGPGLRPPERDVHV